MGQRRVPRRRPGRARRVHRRAGGACWPRSAATPPGWSREARTSVSGGKRFRAAFCYWGHRAVAPDAGRRGRAGPRLRVARAAARQRAGPRRPDGRLRHPARPARPRTAPFAAEHRAAGWRGDPEQYGAAAAILLGDLLLSWSDELLRRCGLPFAQVAPALEVFDRCRSEVIAGQFLDVSVQARGRADVDDRDDRAALQVGEVLHRAAAAHRRRPRRRLRRRRWPR